MLHGGLMFERFTNHARHVVVLAQEEARRLNHNYIGTEHVLLGLLGEPGGVAFRALESFGMSLEGTREEVKAMAGTGNSTVSGHIPFTPRAKKTLELALREALQLHHDYIGTEHILLGVMRDGDGAGAQVLKQHSADLMPIRMAVLDLLSTVPTEATRGRRWLRRRSAADPGEAPEPGEPAELRTTPAADTSLSEAARLAGSQPVGSHHLLLAALGDPDTAAARALAALGLTGQPRQARPARNRGRLGAGPRRQPADLQPACWRRVLVNAQKLRPRRSHTGAPARYPVRILRTAGHTGGMGRMVTAVVTHGGACAGVVGPFPVDIPWWAEVEPVVTHLEEMLGVPVVVLRLLTVEGSDGARDGHVTYHAEALQPPGNLTPCDFVDDDHPLRLPWARASGVRELFRWASQYVDLTGRPAQRKTWNLAGLFRLPTADGPVWLKAIPAFAAAEPTAIAAFAEVDPDLVPTVLASAPGRLLLADVPGTDC